MALPALVVAGVVGLTAVTGTTVAVVATAGESAVVQRVVHGDTFDAVSEDSREIRVRLLNVDTPETKDPNAPVECLGPEASARLEQLLPQGSTVTLDRDVETVDGYGRELAGVTNADGVFVNEQLAREGLGIPLLVGDNGRFHGEVVAANGEARAARRGLYAPDVTCTVPAQVQQVETAPGAGAASVAYTPEQYDVAADQSDDAVARARQLLAVFDGPRLGPVWSAFTRTEQDAFRARVQAVADRAAQSGTSSRTTATTMRERAAAQQRAQEEAARAEAARQEDLRRETARQDALRRRSEEQARADARRAAGSSTDSGSSSSSRSSGGSASSGSADGAYPGYTGPRCYAPGGRTWRPC